MMLFDLKDYKKEDMVTYLKCMAAIAAADGVVDDTEKAYFNHLMELFDLPESSRMFIRNNLKNPPPLGPLLKGIDDAKIKNQIIRDAYLMAYADEKLHPDESKALETIKGIFKISDEHIQLVSSWAKRGSSWRKEGYELSIIE